MGILRKRAYCAKRADFARRGYRAGVMVLASIALRLEAHAAEGSEKNLPLTQDFAEPLRYLAIAGIIAGLIYLTAYGLRRFAGWSRNLGSTSTSMEILESLPLGNGRLLLVTRVGARVLLLGVGDGSVNLVTELEDWKQEEPAKGRARGRERFRELAARYSKEGEDESAFEEAPRERVETLI